MKILLLGKNGQVGWELQRSLASLGEVAALIDTAPISAAIWATGLGCVRPCNACSPTSSSMPAHTAVDKAESASELARLINATAPGVLAQEVQKLGAWLVHYSTDYVFDGSGSQPWAETDTSAPLSVYGQTKLEGEQLIAQHCPNHLIFRTSWVYAARGGNFAKTMLRLARQRERRIVIDDQWGAPTGAELIADVTAHAVCEVLQGREGPEGIYHLAARGQANWNSYAKHVLAQAAQLQKAIELVANEVTPVPTSAFPTPAARRPHNSRLNTDKLQATFGLRLPPGSRAWTACWPKSCKKRERTQS